jgi:hypothetical protein
LLALLREPGSRIAAGYDTEHDDQRKEKYDSRPSHVLPAPVSQAPEPQRQNTKHHCGGDTGPHRYRRRPDMNRNADDYAHHMHRRNDGENQTGNAESETLIRHVVIIPNNGGNFIKNPVKTDLT